MAKPTAYARKNGAYVDPDLRTGRWWLRSPGFNWFGAAFVNSYGYVDVLGDHVNIDDYCVRPVISVSL